MQARGRGSSTSGWLPDQDRHDDLEAGIMLHQHMQQQVQLAALDHDDGVGGSESDPPHSDVESGPVEEPPLPPATVAIPMVREQLRRVASGDLFTPQTVAIGPYHQRAGGGCPFPWTETEKTKVVWYVGTLIGEADLARLRLLVAEMAPQVWECYTHPHPLQDLDVFSRMLLHDGCYVLCFLLGLVPQNNGTTTGENDDRRAAVGGGGGGAEHTIAARDNTLVRDILYLLENQMPLFLLTTMLDHIRGDVVPGQKSAAECVAEPVRELLHEQFYISEQGSTTQTVQSSTCSDLLHLVHSYFRRPGPPHPQLPGGGAGRRSLTGRWRRATDYSRHADVRFKRRVFGPDEEWTVLDVRYDRGTLHVPFLRVGASTMTMLRNLMAMEEGLEDRPVTAYCVFVSQLACTAEDVYLLQRAKVLEHFLGSDDEAARGLADLCNGVALDIDNERRNYLKPTWHHLDRRCRMPLHSFMGLFREKYCRNFFYRLVFFVALVVFLSQVIQVTYAVLAYHRPPK